MVNNQNIDIREAQSFAAAMGRLATEGEGNKGYIRKERAEFGHRYEYIQPGQSKSGKMNVKDVVKIANSISTFAARTTLQQGGLSGQELKNIQEGLARLQTRITRHRPTAFQRFVNFTRIASTILQQNYRNTLETAIRSASAPTIGVSERREIVGSYLNDTDPATTLWTHRNDKLNDKFRAENELSIQKLTPFGLQLVSNAINDNVSLTTASGLPVQNDLKEACKTELNGRLAVLCNGRNLAEVRNNPTFQTLIAKYRQTFDPTTTKTEVEIVREAGVTTFSETASQASVMAHTSQAVGQVAREFARPLKRPLAFFKDLGKKGGKLIQKLSPKKDQPNVPITSSVASSSTKSGPSLSPAQRLADRVLQLEQGSDESSRTYNYLRRSRFAKIMEKTGIEQPQGKKGAKARDNYLDYLRKSIWGALVGNIKSLPKNLRINNDVKRAVEGENAVNHMFYMYHMLETHPSRDPNQQRLKEDLERSLPFAFEADVVGGNQDREDILTGRIQAELARMTPGQKLYLPIGCDGHATLLVMTKTDRGVEIQHFNTGLGLDDHRRLANNPDFSMQGLWRNLQGTSNPIAVGFEVDLSTADKQQHLRDALGFFINTASFEGTTMNDVSRGLAKLHNLAGTGEMKITVDRKKPQQTGNCSYRCLMEGFRNAMGENSYRNFKVNLAQDYRSGLVELTRTAPKGIDGTLLAGLDLVEPNVRRKQEEAAQGQSTQRKRQHRKRT